MPARVRIATAVATAVTTAVTLRAADQLVLHYPDRPSAVILPVRQAG